METKMTIRFDPKSMSDIQDALDIVQECLDAFSEEHTFEFLKEFQTLTSFELLNSAWRHFGCKRFDLTKLSKTIQEAENREIPMRTLHAHLGNITRAENKRGIKLFNRHGQTGAVTKYGKPSFEYSIKEEIGEELEKLLESHKTPD